MLLKNLFGLLVLGVVELGAVYAQNINDHIFPGKEASKKFIDFDNKGFMVNGQRTFLVSASMEYARVPRGLWEDRLLRIKRAGFNCIEIYTIWNFHEAKEGVFDFTGDRDLDAFLKLVEKMGLYSIVRVGPYYCAEWDLGGYPIWLRNKIGLRVREPNEPFETAMNKYFDKLFPIVFSHQIHRGGSVVLVQLENEHPKGWGTVEPDDYFRRLRAKALSMGLEVPYFYSGLHHANDPAGETMLDDSTRPNPWFTTEFWSVWYSSYGSGQKEAAEYGRRTWKIISRGGNGYNVYMAHGGSNFGYTNNDEDAASYDFGSAIGQTGDLRPMYYAYKRANGFARSFETILENSKDGTPAYAASSSNPAVKATARTSPSGDILFLDNPGTEPATTNVNGKELVLSPGEIIGVLYNYSLSATTTVKVATTRILRVLKQDKKTTLVVYGGAGENAQLEFSLTTKAEAVKGKESFKIASKQILFSAPFPVENKPTLYSFKVGNEQTNIVVLNDSLAKYTWFVNENNEHFVITGPSFVGKSSVKNGQLSFETEKFWNARNSNPVCVVSMAGDIKALLTRETTRSTLTGLTLAKWEAREATDEASVSYNDSGWLRATDPLQMGADNDTTADAWYRTTVNVPETAFYTLAFSGGGDRLVAFVDGKWAGACDMRDGELFFKLTKGNHLLAIFSAHDGRLKLFEFVGQLSTVDLKGLSGPVALRKGAPATFSPWKYSFALSNDEWSRGLSLRNDWKPYRLEKDIFRRNSNKAAWFESSITFDSTNPPKAIRFNCLEDNAKNVVVFVNGKQVYRNEKDKNPFEAPLPLLPLGKPSVVTLFVENESGVSGGLNKPIQFLYDSSKIIPVKGWSMRGGVGQYSSSAGWVAMDSNRPALGPRLYRSTFTVPQTSDGSRPVWRVGVKELGHGSIWVNGHNLGRYPEKTAAPGMYLPECWLHEGTNSMMIYDEDGKTPTRVTIEPEMASSRDIQVLTVP